MNTALRSKGRTQKGHAYKGRTMKSRNSGRRISNVDHSEKWMDLKHIPNLKGKILFSCIGIAIISMGIAICRVGGVGVDSFTAMNIGISEKIGLSLGTYQLFVNLAILVLVFFLDKYQIGIGTLVNMVAVGYLVDIFAWMLSFLPVNPADSIVGMTVCLIAGTLTFTFGISLYLRTEMGVSPYDAIAPIAHDRTGVSYAVCRVFQDIAVMAVAFFVAGPIGIFTPVAAFCTGPIIEMWNKSVTKRIYERFHVLSKQEMAKEF